MKYLHFCYLTLFLLYSNAQAATIYDIKNGVSVFSDTYGGSTGVYFDQTFSDFATSSPLSNSELAADITGGDLTNYAWTPNAHLPSSKLPGINPVNNSYVDLGFSGGIYNGDGADLVLFFAGNGTSLSTGIEEYAFSLDIGANGSIEIADSSVITSTSSDLYGDAFYASYAIIDLDGYGFDQSTPLGDIRVHLGDSSMPALAALGAYHTTAVVPLPLPVILFSSGLACLGWIGRRKKV